MKEFFHGWRRKAGCVSLVMACVMAGMWMRSYGDGDVIRIHGFGRSILLDSTQGCIVWYEWRGGSGARYPFWSSRSYRPFTVTNAANGDLPDVPDINLQLALMVIPGQVWKLAVLYWYLLLPLTLLSACLILWKPRTRA